MKKLYYLIFILISYSSLSAQTNCQAFLYYGDTLKYEACIKSEESKEHYQFSKEFQEIFDEVVKIDSTYAEAYSRKSTAYLKSADFVTWKELMDKAVKFDPKNMLEYRGRMQFKCFRNYQGALNDFEELGKLINIDYLFVEKALCYKGLGKNDKALDILEKFLETEGAFGNTGYIHLGVLYLEQKRYQEAIEVLLKQQEINNLAENQFYLALAYKAIQLTSEYKRHLNEAKTLYLKGSVLYDVYINHMDKIYLIDIENELNS